MKKHLITSGEIFYALCSFAFESSFFVLGMPNCGKRSENGSGSWKRHRLIKTRKKEDKRSQEKGDREYEEMINI